MARAIDPRSGFKVNLDELVRDGQTGDMILARFSDRKHPQDFVRGRMDKMALPFTRPEPPEVGIAQPIELEGGLYLVAENGSIILGEGVIPSL